MVHGWMTRKRLDRAQRKIVADFFEKFALAIATAVSAKVFFAEEGLTAMTYCAIAVSVVFFVLSLVFAHGTEKDDATPMPGSKGDNKRNIRKKRK